MSPPLEALPLDTRLELLERRIVEQEAILERLRELLALPPRPRAVSESSRPAGSSAGSSGAAALAARYLLTVAWRLLASAVLFALILAAVAGILKLLRD